MKFRNGWIELAVAMLAGNVVGCGNTGSILDILGISSNTVTVRLENDTPFLVEPNVYVSSVASSVSLFDEITEEIVTIGINKQNFDDLGSGGVTSRRYDCDEIKAIMASDAEMKTGVGLSPDADSALFIEGDDFRCGDTITIRYAGSLGSFNASISAASFDILGILTSLGGGG